MCIRSNGYCFQKCSNSITPWYVYLVRQALLNPVLTGFKVGSYTHIQATQKPDNLQYTTNFTAGDLSSIQESVVGSLDRILTSSPPNKVMDSKIFYKSGVNPSLSRSGSLNTPSVKILCQKDGCQKVFSTQSDYR
jgi:hypothetical protein